ncbi:uncharacterized protein J7T55_005757 [Diaporthe amygdali]|uniref:uncharacterized protein n=1 Tax=Phomopsis amygdali TaxID=1214568 RepID=UPI0022FEE62C|nr:uncharacterized protein J7T55_005757 [Diaporthe amygdali]KAJ0124419.1 uncharacterized protein J7T55_005757 [Diaporthe amygdali]
MSLSTTEPITATSTGPIAIRTPFVQPQDCKTQWKTTTVPASVVSGTTIMTPILISEPAATCYPSRWDEVTPESRLSFSPGVCPEGWVYNAMAEDGSSAASTAFCCNSGFSYLGFPGYALVTSLVPNRCGKFARNIEDDAEDSSDTNLGKSVMVHQGWAITWAASDTATLTPKLPTLTSSMRVPTWTPGQEIKGGAYDPSHPSPSTREYLSDGSYANRNL